MKKAIYYIQSSLVLFIFAPIARLISKSWYEKKVLPNTINRGCSSKPTMYQRKKVIPGAYGEVLEIGIGPGINIQFYDPTKVTKIIGVDPSAELNKIAQKNADKVNIPIDFLITTAEEIPLPDNSIDTVISTYTLCSIPNPSLSLKEIFRVLKPEGKFLFCEHGIAPSKGVAMFQNAIDFFWPAIAGGCHLNRDMPSLLKSNEFNLEELDAMYLPGTQRFIGYNYWGVATT